MDPYYQDGSVTIYHGDCREIDAWLTADVMVTDPPYGIGWKRGVGTGNSKGIAKSHDGIDNDHDTSCRDDTLALAPTMPAVVFGSFYAPTPANLKQVLVWHKGDTQGVVGSVTGFRRDVEPIYLCGPWPIRKVLWSSVIRSARGSWLDESAATGHPHTKPVDLMRTLIVAVGASGVIADPFMGSGTTLRAAKDLGFQAIGIETNERHCETAARRMGQEVLDFGTAV